jgi:hypothetical protein
MRRDLALLILTFVALAALIGLGPGRQEEPAWGGPSSHVSGPHGALGLYLWLDELGYQAERLQYEAFDPARADLLIVLGPITRYSREEAEAVRAWVEAGGVLIVAEDRTALGAPAGPLLAAFDLAVVPAPAGAGAASAPVLQPALGAPPARRLAAPGDAVVAAERDDLAPLAGTNEHPVLAGLQVGEGYVFASAADYPFSNDGLRDRDNAAAALNLLRRIPPGGRVVFDEIHHGFVGQPSLRGLLIETPWGWATLYGLAVAAGYLALTGRRLGRPMPLTIETARRSSAEYLTSMAGLLRRAGKGVYIQNHFRASFKRRIARASGLSPDQGDEELVAALAQTRPADARAVAELLARMAGPPGDDKALLALVRDADTLLEK